jgi:DNA mismatch repair protein MutS2
MMGLTRNQNDSEKTQIILESLELLEWPIVCSHLSTFAVTQQGQKNVKALICHQISL